MASTADLGFLSGKQLSTAKVLIVSPHPDDEVIGAGCPLPLLKNAVIVQVTDGSPLDLSDARRNGFGTREEYARMRRAELQRAIDLAGEFEAVDLGFLDQSASFHLREITSAVKAVIVQRRPDYIITVPYEGGHPDHDATAFAVHSACAQLPGNAQPRVVEMLSYHNRNGRCEMTEFLPASTNSIAFQLDAEERAVKQRMFDCFFTQKSVLQWFSIALEKFRLAPAYDFLAPPHAGQLYYEIFPWGMNGAAWRELAREALAPTHDRSLLRYELAYS
jgi:LmbE family N-acetylglucosaminyl deacetylase